MHRHNVATSEIKPYGMAELAVKAVGRDNGRRTHRYDSGKQQKQYSFHKPTNSTV